MKLCLHQFIRPKVKWKSHNHGDCTICKRDKNNKFCVGYTPIEVSVIDIKDEDKKNE